MEIYVDKIKVLCGEQNISITELCKKADISRVTFWTWKTKKKSPTAASIKSIASVLHVPVNMISNLPSPHEESDAPVEALTNSWLSFAQKKDLEILAAQNDYISKIKKDYIEFRQAKIIINALMNSMDFIVYMKDKNLNYIAANKAFITNAGLIENFDISNKDDHFFFPNNEARKNHIDDENVFLSGVPIINKEIIIPGTRRKKWGLATKQIIFDLEGKAAGIIGVIVDITEKKSIDQQRILLEHALNQIDDACITFGRFHPTKNIFIFEYINETLKKILQLPNDFDYSKLPEYWLKILPENSKKIFQQRRNANNFPAHFTYQAIRPSDGKTVWLQDSVYKSGDRLISIVRDITAQKQLIKEIKNYEFIFDSLPSAVEVLDYETFEILYTNNKLEKIFGHPKELVKDYDYWLNHIIHPSCREEQINYKKNDNIPELRTYKIIRADGTVTSLKTNHLIKENNGKKYRVVINSKE